MGKINQLRIFLASPGDVQQERKLARKVIEELNTTVARSHGMTFEIVGWETHTISEYGRDPQRAVNAQIADMSQYDLFIGIMWNRFGQPTPRAGSGTEEEFELAVQAFSQNGRPHIMWFFGTKPFAFSNEDDLEQKKSVIKFQKKVQQRGLIQNYDGPEDFEEKLRKNLTGWISRQDVRVPEVPEETRSSNIKITNRRVSKPSRSLNWVMLKGGFFQVVNIVEGADGSVAFQIEPNVPEQEIALKELRSRSAYGNENIPFAYQDEAGFAILKSAERRLEGDRSMWSITIKPDEPQRNQSLWDVSYNNLSGDEIAEMRARYMLLGETPVAASGRNKDVLRFVVAGGHSTGITPEPIFPQLWRKFSGGIQGFLPLARLWALFHLKTTNTCEHVLKLELKPSGESSLNIDFYGRRRRVYSNQDPSEIRVKGQFHLVKGN